jgi:predicted RNA-binding protein with PUA-like domain
MSQRATARRYWLVKSEPEVYGFEDLLRERVARWDGVRNFQARNHLRAMKEGDLVLVYHSQSDKSVVGIAEVVREHYPDPTAREGDFSAVDLAPHASLKNPVSLGAIKKEATLADLPLIRQSRLSVMPIDASAFDTIVKMGGGARRIARRS